MQFLFTADLHFSDYSNDPMSEGLPERLFSLNKSFRSMFEYAISNKINKIVIGGDINHNKTLFYTLAKSVFLDIVRDYKSSVDLVIIDGNHDMSSKSGSGVSSLKSLDNEPNIHMVHYPEKIENIFFVPWNDKSMVETIKSNSADFLVGHFGLNEGTMNSGISIVSDLGLKDLQNYGHCLLGHYHSPQTKGNATYVGSLIQLDWGERDEEKSFLFVDSNSKEMKRIESTGYFKHFQLNVDKSNIKDVIEFANEMKAQGHHVRLDTLETGNAIEKLKESFVVIDKSEKDFTNRGIDSSMGISEIMERYLSINNIESKENYKNIGFEIINRSRGV